MIRFGLCCKLLGEDIKFREARYVHIKKVSRSEYLLKFSEIIISNLQALLKTLNFCRENRILAFRIGSQLLPLYTHPDCPYKLDELSDADLIFALFKECREYALKHQIRLSFHPDQFVVLNSPREDVLANALKDLHYHLEMAELLGVDVINIHAGGVYGDKNKALERLEREIDKLPNSLLSKLTLENDDRSFTPQDLLPLCLRTKVPLIYDVHHHRCLPDELSIEEATDQAVKTWNREPYFHVSSPKYGWDSTKKRPHHDYIDIEDFPKLWTQIGHITVDVEAKAKELSVLRLMGELENQKNNKDL